MFARVLLTQGTDGLDNHHLSQKHMCKQQPPATRIKVLSSLSTNRILPWLRLQPHPEKHDPGAYPGQGACAETQEPWTRTLGPPLCPSTLPSGLGAPLIPADPPGSHPALLARLWVSCPWPSSHAVSPAILSPPLVLATSTTLTPNLCLLSEFKRLPNNSTWSPQAPHTQQVSNHHDLAPSHTQD